MSRALGDTFYKDPKRPGALFCHCSTIVPCFALHHLLPCAWLTRLVHHMTAMEWLVSAIPEIKEESLQPGADEFFIVASDGFWDVFSNENAVLLTRELLQKKELSLADVAQTLTAKAFSR